MLQSSHQSAYIFTCSKICRFQCSFHPILSSSVLFRGHPWPSLAIRGHPQPSGFGIAAIEERMKLLATLLLGDAATVQVRCAPQETRYYQVTTRGAHLPEYPESCVEFNVLARCPILWQVVTWYDTFACRLQSLRMAISRAVSWSGLGFGTRCQRQLEAELQISDVACTVPHEMQIRNRHKAPV